MKLGLKEPLDALVKRRFVSARESENLIFSTTQLAILTSKRGIEYQLRYCPALAKKPTADKQKSQKPTGPKPDPFENPSADLLITEIPLPPNTQNITKSNGNDDDVDHHHHEGGGASPQSSHFLVLNKFPVIPNHFILATTSFKKQTDLLDKEDLAAAFACLKSWSHESQSQDDSQEIPNEGRRLFAFFNSGDESGASQPHRHLQFLPFEDMRGQEQEKQQQQQSQDSKSSGSWIPLIDRLLPSSPSSSNIQITQSGLRYLPDIPFKHYAVLIQSKDSVSDANTGPDDDSNPSAGALHDMYLSLYRAALSASGVSDNHELNRTAGPAAMSYNLAMTKDVMMICPRRKESASLMQSTTSDSSHNIENSDNDDSVALNGTILAGTLMVKSEEQWDRLRGNAELVNSLLEGVGLPYQS